MSQTRQFMLRMGTYGPDQLEDGQLPEYRELVTEVITPKFAGVLRGVGGHRRAARRPGRRRPARPRCSRPGVVTLDSDSATALVAGTFTDTYRTAKGEEQEQRPVPFRIEVDLVKTDGEWLVDDFTPVTGGEQ